MPNTHSANPSASIKHPVCPDCGTAMRLERAAPDSRYRNIHHMIFTCDCGRASDQMIAVPE